MIINEQRYLLIDRFNDRLITNFYTQTSKGIESKHVEIMLHMKDDALNDYMDDNDMTINLTAEEYKQFLLMQLEELNEYTSEKESDSNGTREQKKSF